MAECVFIKIQNTITCIKVGMCSVQLLKDLFDRVMSFCTSIAVKEKLTLNELYITVSNPTML